MAEDLEYKMKRKE